MSHTPKYFGPSAATTEIQVMKSEFEQERRHLACGRGRPAQASCPPTFKIFSLAEPERKWSLKSEVGSFQNS